MTPPAPLSLDRDQQWQHLTALSDERCYELLLSQLDAPSFAVPIAAREPGIKAFAQVLFFPLAAQRVIDSAIKRLCDEGRVESFSNNFDGILTDRGFGFVLVVRPDDPALAPSRQHQGPDACAVAAA